MGACDTQDTERKVNPIPTTERLRIPKIHTKSELPEYSDDVLFVVIKLSVLMWCKLGESVFETGVIDLVLLLINACVNS